MDKPTRPSARKRRRRRRRNRKRVQRSEKRIERPPRSEKRIERPPRSENRTARIPSSGKQTARIPSSGKQTTRPGKQTARSTRQGKRKALKPLSGKRKTAPRPTLRTIMKKPAETGSLMKLKGRARNMVQYLGCTWASSALAARLDLVRGPDGLVFLDGQGVVVANAELEAYKERQKRLENISRGQRAYIPPNDDKKRQGAQQPRQLVTTITVFGPASFPAAKTGKADNGDLHHLAIAHLNIRRVQRIQLYSFLHNFPSSNGTIFPFSSLYSHIENFKVSFHFFFFFRFARAASARHIRFRELVLAACTGKL